MKIKKTTVNLVHLNSSPGGIEVLLPGIIKAFNNVDFSVFVIRSKPDTLPSVYGGLEDRVTYGSRNNFIAIVRLIRYVIRRRDEIFHLFNTGPLFLLFLRMAGARRLIYSIHGTVYWHNRFEKTSRLILWRMAINRGKLIFTANSEYSREMFRKQISAGIQCEVLYNYVDQSRFTAIARINLNDPVKRIIYAGRLAPGKGLERWINVALKIHTVMPEMLFLIYGEGQLGPMLRNTIESARATNFIKMIGYSPEMERVYREADLLLFLSEYESFGNVVVESILSGTPVLVSDIPGLKEILSDFPEFILTPRSDTAAEILQKLGNIRFLRERTAVARDIFRERFSARRHFGALAGIYESV
ncbi:MAG: glycosyltransferase family 4 protein [Bacteroidales bacterium]|nr:glycosyltransferase family 4 protein [Bacteroidales bacterium]